MKSLDEQIREIEESNQALPVHVAKITGWILRDYFIEPTSPEIVVIHTLEEIAGDDRYIEVDIAPVPPPHPQLF